MTIVMDELTNAMMTSRNFNHPLVLHSIQKAAYSIEQAAVYYFSFKVFLANPT